MARTCDILFESCIMDEFPDSYAVMVDFGMDIAVCKDPAKIYEHYHKAIRTGAVTAEDLQKACGNGPKLSALIGTKVVTIYDFME